MAKKNDPTVTSDRGGEQYPPGTHPARPVEEADDAAVNKEYREMPGKPDPSTVAQVEIRPDEK